MTSTVITAPITKCSYNTIKTLSLSFPFNKTLGIKVQYYTDPKTCGQCEPSHPWGVGTLFNPFLNIQLHSFPPVSHYFSNPPWPANRAQAGAFHFRTDLKIASLLSHIWMRGSSEWLLSAGTSSFSTQLTANNTLLLQTLLPLNMRSVYLDKHKWNQVSKSRLISVKKTHFMEFWDSSFLLPSLVYLSCSRRECVDR